MDGRKNQHFQIPIRPAKFDQDRVPAWKPAKADVASSLNIIIYAPALRTKEVQITKKESK